MSGALCLCLEVGGGQSQDDWKLSVWVGLFDSWLPWRLIWLGCFIGEILDVSVSPFGSVLVLFA